MTQGTDRGATAPRMKTHGAVIYTRVSTGEQAKHGSSLESQLDVCRLKAVALNLPIVAEYEDAGVSGGILVNRVRMQSALSDIREGRADTLICANISRYSRDVEHQQNIRKVVRAAGGTVVFCDMQFDDTPEGDLAFNIMGGFAQYERQLIRTRSMRGKRKWAESGQQPQRSTPAYGYHIITNAQVECGLYPPELRGHYLIIEEEAKIVRELFTRYASGGVGLTPLARDLNARRVPAPRGGAWHPVTIGIILRNPVYRGEAAYNRISHSMGEATGTERHPLTGTALRNPRVVRTEGKPVYITVPPIVSEEIWHQAQEKKTSNKSHQGGNPRRARMLSGRIFCPCGHSAALIGSPKAKYYQCSEAFCSKFLYGTPTCARTAYSVAKMEASVVLALIEAISHPTAIASAIETYQESLRDRTEGADSRSVKDELKALDRALEQLKEEEAIAIQAQMAGMRAGASADAYRDIFEDIAGRRKDIQDRRGVVARQIATQSNRKESKPLPVQETKLQVYKDVATVLTTDDLTGNEKRDLLATVVDHVVCQPDGAEVHFHSGLGSAVGQPSDFSEDGSDTLKSILTELIQYRCPVG